MVRCPHKGLRLLLACGLCLAASRFQGMTADDGGWLFSKDGRRLVDSAKQPVVLRNNPQAKDVALAQVLAFIKTNQVNTRAYRAGQFVCAEFAVALHDEAEAAGLRCGLVGVRFQRGAGHALNVFNTTDQGPVYIDCTGSPFPGRDPGAFDTIGYLRIGQPYGRLPLELGAFDPSHYERYTYVMGLWTWVRLERRRIERDAAQLGARREQDRQDPPERHNPDDPLAGVSTNGLAFRPDDFQQPQRDLAERREKLRLQLQRLQTRYDMNAAPVKAIDVWW